jgi:hypothetical protein
MSKNITILKLLYNEGVLMKEKTPKLGVFITIILSLG